MVCVGYEHLRLSRIGFHADHSSGTEVVDWRTENISPLITVSVLIMTCVLELGREQVSVVVYIAVVQMRCRPWIKALFQQLKNFRAREGLVRDNG